jgi:hypothetical protein
VLKPPIVVKSRGNLLVFHSVAAAEASLDPIDVRNGAYAAAYDSDGRLLRAEVRVRERRVLGLFRQVTEQSRLVECEHVPTHDRELRALVLQYVSSPAAAAAAEAGNPLEGLIRWSPRRLRIR